MTAKNKELKNELDENVAREEVSKTLSSFRQRLRENRELAEKEEIIIKHDDDKGSDDKDGDDKKDKKKDKKPPFLKKDGDGDGDKDDMKEDTTVTEESTGAATLHPKSKSVDDGKALTGTKVDMMKNMVNYMSGLNKSDLTAWFKQAMDCYGPGKHFGVGDVDGSNSASIDSKLGKGPKTKNPMPTIHVREDLNEILSGTELSEEVLEKTTALFEAAVQARTILETQRLEEEYVETLSEEIDHFTAIMTEKLDNYLDYVVENWMAENKIAVESALRTEVTTDFIESLKGVFAEHYIDVPEDKVDVLEAMVDKVEMLESRLETVVSENALLKDAVIGGAKQEIVENVGKDLTQADQEKFATLAEGIEFEGDFDAYANKLTIVKENYFNGTSKKVTQSNILEETFEGDEGKAPTSQYVDPAVNRYASAIGRTVKGMAAQS